MNIITFLNAQSGRMLFGISLIVATVITALTYGVGHYMGWTDLSNPNWIEISAIWTSYSSVFLCNFQSRWNYPIGIAGVGLYSAFYWTMTPPADALAVFNLYLVFSLAFGYFRWGPDGNTRPVDYVRGIWWLPYLAVTALVVGAMYVAMAYGAVFNGTTEIVIVAASALAQFLMDNKRLQSWVVWIAVDVVSIYFYGWVMGWNLVAFQYVFFLANAVWGLYVWRKAYVPNTITTIVVPAE